MKGIAAATGIILVLSLVCLGEAQTTPPVEKKSYADRLRDRRQSMMETQSTRAIDLLVLLQQGDTAQAIERLEREIDDAICTTWASLETDSRDIATAADPQKNLAFLQTLKAYRSKHPKGSTGVQSEKAKQILAELKDKQNGEPKPDGDGLKPAP